MAEKKTTTKDTRLVRLDMDLKVTVQLEVSDDTTPDQARENALRSVNAAIRRAEEDQALKITRQAGEQYHDRKAK